MKSKVLFMMAVIFLITPQVAFAQAGAWGPPGETSNSGAGRNAGPDTRSWNLETMRLDTRPIEELLRSGYQVKSVELNYLSGTTEMFLFNADGQPQLLHCQLKGQSSAREQMTVATRCMGF